jgi:hypothetical protein
LNALFPLLSIFTAEAILTLVKNKKWLKIFSIVQVIQAALLVSFLLLLNYFFVERSLHADTIIALVFCFGMALFLTLRKSSYLKRIIFVPAFVIIGINYYLNREFYPTLMKYQAESNLALYFKHNGLPADKLITLDAGVILTDVMLERIIPNYDITATSKIDFDEKLVFTSKKGLVGLQSLGRSYEIIANFDDYPLTKLSLPFLNKKTRKENLEKKYLVKVLSSKF